MKLIRVLFTILSVLSIPSAHASQVSQVRLSANAAEQSIQMTDKTFEPIYENQPYQATCSREVLDHMESVCSTVSDNVCRGGEEVCTTQADQVCNTHGCTSVPRRVCSAGPQVCQSVPRRVCNDQAVMRTEFYSCTQYHDVVVGQRLVKTFQNSVEVSVDRPELLQDQALTISLLARENAVTPTLVSSFPLNLLTVETQTTSTSDNGAIAMLATRITIRVGESIATLNQLLSSSVQELALSPSSITLMLPGVASLVNELSLNVSLTQHRAIIADKKLFVGTLDLAGLSVTQGGGIRVTLPLAKMNLSSLASKRHNVSVSISLKRPSLSILNEKDVDAVLNKKLEATIKDITP